MIGKQCILKWCHNWKWQSERASKQIPKIVRVRQANVTNSIIRDHKIQQESTCDAIDHCVHVIILSGVAKKKLGVLSHFNKPYREYTSTNIKKCLYYCALANWQASRSQRANALYIHLIKPLWINNCNVT